MTKETLSAELNELLNNKRYMERAKEVSRIFKDNPIHPMDEAMYWMEYVIQHKGAKHLKSKAVNMPFYQYFMLDIIALCVGVILLIFTTISTVFKLICCRESSNVTRSSKKKKTH